MLCSLANPHYLHELAASGFLDDGAPFLAFVDYLAYWEQPAFAKYIMCVPLPLVVPCRGARPG